MTPSDKIRAAIARSRELSRKATEPWYAQQPTATPSNGWGGLAIIIGLDLRYVDRSPAFDKDDAAFIAHARTALPRHADALEIALGLLEKLEKLCPAWRDQPIHFKEPRAEDLNEIISAHLAAIAAKLEGQRP